VRHARVVGDDDGRGAAALLLAHDEQPGTASVCSRHSGSEHWTQCSDCISPSQEAALVAGSR
jgi:hypothetical protein